MPYFPYIEWLARSYKDKAEATGLWTDYLKVSIMGRTYTWCKGTFAPIKNLAKKYWFFNLFVQFLLIYYNNCVVDNTAAKAAIF